MASLRSADSLAALVAAGASAFSAASNALRSEGDIFFDMLDDQLNVRMRSESGLRGRRNQKTRAAGAGGRSTSYRISPSKRLGDSRQAELQSSANGGADANRNFATARSPLRRD